MGEGEGGGGQNRFGLHLVPSPLIPSRGGEGSFLLWFLKSVRDKFSDSVVLVSNRNPILMVRGAVRAWVIMMLCPLQADLI